MSLVADNSVIVRWCMVDEDQDVAMQLLAKARTQTILVPALWPTEFANALGRARRQKRINQETFQAALDLVGSLDIRVSSVSGPHEVPTLLALMQQFALTAYDAAYLSLAIETSLPLETFDDELLKAAELAGVPLFN